MSYVAVNGEDPANAAIGMGPHAADGILLKDGGMIAVGVAVPNLTTDIGHGYVARVNACSNPAKYESKWGTHLRGKGNDCATNYKWQFSMKNGKRSHLVSVKVSNFII